MGPRVPLSLPINRSEIYGEIRKKAEGEAREKTRKKEKKKTTLLYQTNKIKTKTCPYKNLPLLVQLRTKTKRLVRETRERCSP